MAYNLVPPAGYQVFKHEPRGGHSISKPQVPRLETPPLKMEKDTGLTRKGLFNGSEVEVKMVCELEKDYPISLILLRI